MGLIARLTKLEEWLQPSGYSGPMAIIIDDIYCRPPTEEEIAEVVAEARRKGLSVCFVCTQDWNEDDRFGEA